MKSPNYIIYLASLSDLFIFLVGKKTVGSRRLIWPGVAQGSGP